MALPFHQNVRPPLSQAPVHIWSQDEVGSGIDRRNSTRARKGGDVKMRAGRTVPRLPSNCVAAERARTAAPGQRPMQQGTMHCAPIR